MASNHEAGGALWSWFSNGVEYVNSHDYGRLIQTAVFCYTAQGEANPTEAGSGPYDGGGALHHHGSPTLELYNSGSKQISKAIPLEFAPSAFGGNVEDQVLWKDMTLGKEIELNWNGMSNVAKYTTKVYTPVTLEAVMNSCVR